MTGDDDDEAPGEETKVGTPPLALLRELSVATASDQALAVDEEDFEPTQLALRGPPAASPPAPRGVRRTSPDAETMELPRSVRERVVAAFDARRKASAPASPAAVPVVSDDAEAEATGQTETLRNAASVPDAETLEIRRSDREQLVAAVDARRSASRLPGDTQRITRPLAPSSASALPVVGASVDEAYVPQWMPPAGPAAPGSATVAAPPPPAPSAKRGGAGLLVSVLLLLAAAAAAAYWWWFEIAAGQG